MGQDMNPVHGRARVGADPTGRGNATRVLIVDDHHLVRLAIETLLADEDDVEIVAQADSVRQATVALASCRPDVVIVDLHLPDGDGLDLCRAASAQGVSVLVLTAYAGEELIVEAMQAGASGYVLKQDPADEIVTALRTVGSGGAHFSGAATPQMIAMIASGGLPEDPLSHLSERERELLGLLGEGLSNRQIADRLFLGERTVKNYVSRLLRKLDLDRRAEAAVYAAKLEAERQMRRYAVAPRG